MGTKNLITGIGGFVASHLADYLLEKGEEVYGTCRWTEDMSRIIHIKDKIKLIPMDLNDLSSCIRAIKETKPDYIFHLAAQSYVPDSFIYPEETIRTNTIGTLNLLEAVRIVRQDLSQTNEYGIVYDTEEPTPGKVKSTIDKNTGETRNLVNVQASGRFDPVIHVCSSSEVYGLVKKEDIPIKESQAFNPSNPYAVGKVGEDMIALMYWTNYRIKTIRTRMFTHTGPRRTMMSAECNFARQIARIEKGLQDPIILHGNLESIRTWADVRDAVRAYWLLVRKCRPGEVYNIGGKTTKTIGEVLDYLISLSPMKDKIQKKQDPKLMRPYDVTLQIPDCYKFLEETGWQRTIKFEQTMQDLLNWWREYEI
jgi:GDP-D-mannose dehydratase